ncbi:hypothetical protein GSI_13196 [Ganoderma sinense ZZ0214-1]|uniref:Uncharacterized protein n=1 Tax=Ganoderma sinense ZZ0214-1 TaxID=1077348 RepID=A0A2G8RUW8_9APHY|nr:hypothetical protein GSI_13196 [Ganoderma sinense ZZ0214-1]
MNAPGFFAWQAHPQNGLLMASNPIVTDPTMNEVSTPRLCQVPPARKQPAMTTWRTFEGHFEECEPSWPTIIVALLDMDFAIGQGTGETYLRESRKLVGSYDSYHTSYTPNLWLDLIYARMGPMV